MKINKQKEIVICSAVRLKNKIWRGHRHGDALHAMREELSWKNSGEKVMYMIHSDKVEQGFITSYNRFVSREEGRILQDNAKIKSVDKEGYKGVTLFSEDLY